MSKDLETIRVLDDYLLVDTTDRRVCEMSNPTYYRMFRGSRFANEMATLLVEYRNRIAELEEQLKNATKQVRKEVCEEIRKKVIESTCYDTEEEIRSVIYDLNACEVLEILDKLQGETKCQE